MRTAPLWARWVKVADQDGHVHLEECWVPAKPAGEGDNRNVTAAAHAA